MVARWTKAYDDEHGAFSPAIGCKREIGEREQRLPGGTPHLVPEAERGRYHGGGW
jgi:hypothetical protein